MLAPLRLSPGPSFCPVLGSSPTIRAEPVAHAVVEAVHHHVHRDIDRMGEALRIGAAMRLHHHAVQPEHHRAVVAARIEPLAQPVQARPGQQIADLRRQ